MPHSCNRTVIFTVYMWQNRNRNNSFLILKNLKYNYGKLAASFYHHVAALVSDIFCSFYSLKITKLLITQQPLKLDKKINTNLESLEFQKNFDARLTKFKNNQILLHKISQKFLLTTKRKILIAMRDSTVIACIGNRGARYLMGEKLEVVWAEFSTVSQAVLHMRAKTRQHANSHF